MGKEVGAAVGGGALGAALALLFTRRDTLANGGGDAIDKAAIDAIIALAQEQQAGNQALINTLNNLAGAIGGGSAPGVTLQNPAGMTTFVVRVAIAGTPQQLPDVKIPYRQMLVIKGRPNNTNAVFVAKSLAEASNPSMRYPLLQNEPVEYEIRNANVVWVDAVTAGDGVVCTVEQD